MGKASVSTPMARTIATTGHTGMRATSRVATAKAQEKGAPKGKGLSSGGKAGKSGTHFQGYCTGCGKWGHKVADCRSGGKSVGATAQEDGATTVSTIGPSASQAPGHGGRLHAIT